MQYCRILWGALLCACFFVPITVNAKDYGDTVLTLRGNNMLSSFHPEIYISGAYRLSHFYTAKGEHNFKGTELMFSSGAGLWLTRWLMVGGEYGFTSGSGQTEYISQLKVQELGGILKFNLTPDTYPSQYIFIGAGTRKWNYPVLWRQKETGHSAYYRVGLGAQFQLFEPILFRVLWSLTYLPSVEMGNYVRTQTQWENSLGINLTWQF